ncbi:hypothetical protein [Mucilaginibacter sp.]|uniref:hypothetical protein n=1 Tax=Mucilaginibacter sp. TaxID=1882438 RepID=UPI00283FC4A0|nr:hypothetical protein [Mucilaginibacter sp.]MDR3697537.1 hypothetical protein [Mucilaginibacter sp.]
MDTSNFASPPNNLDIQLSRYEKYPGRSHSSPLKKGIWAYFILLIFEGALRKWIVPGLATPLLIVRDPLAIWLFIMAWKRGLLNINIFIAGMFIISGIGFFTAIFWGHGNFMVALFGLRTLIVHWPVIFIIGSIFDRDDVLKVGRFMVWLTIPMTILLIFQFYSPQSAWVNRGVGGDIGGAGFVGVSDYFRPPATFSFTNGTGLFYCLSACFVFYFWLSPQKYIGKLLLICASIALLVAIPFSISRSLFFSVIVILGFSVMAISRQPKSAGRMIIATITILILFTALGRLGIFQTASKAFTMRFTTANETEGGLTGTLRDRYLGGMLDAITNSNELPFFGYGIGMGTNVGSLLLTGENHFLIAEGEWGRLIGEMGILMGLGVIALRLALSFKILLACYKRLTIGDFLPWILLSFCLLTLPQGQWSQPTSLGFSIVAAGFTIASLRRKKNAINHPSNIDRKGI